MLRQLVSSSLARRVCSAAIDQSSHASWLPALPTCAAAAAWHCLPRHFAAQPALDLPEDGAGPPEPPLPADQHNEQGHYRDLVVPLFDLNKRQVGTFVLGGDVFDVPIRRDILHRVVRWQLAKRQAGTHKTKTRSEVRGGGRKPWAQKGSGRARQGTIRAPQWRGGGVAHGPVPRSHEHKLFKRVRRLGLQCALSAKAWEQRLVVVESLKPEDHRTKTMDDHIAALLEGAPRQSALLVDSDKQGEDGGELMRQGIANLPWVDSLPSSGLNVYSILQRDYLVMTRNAVELVMQRMRRPIKPCSPSV